MQEIQVVYLQNKATAAAGPALYPFLHQESLCVQTMVFLPVPGTFNVPTDVGARDCTWGLDEHRKRVCTESELQALVYDTLPSTSYVIGSRKLSANEQFFVGAQTVVPVSYTHLTLPTMAVV